MAHIADILVWQEKRVITIEFSEKAVERQNSAIQAKDDLITTTKVRKAASGGSLAVGELYLIEINMLPRARIQYDFSEKSRAFERMGDITFVRFSAKRGNILCARCSGPSPANVNLYDGTTKGVELVAMPSMKKESFAALILSDKVMSDTDMRLSASTLVVDKVACANAAWRRPSFDAARVEVPPAIHCHLLEFLDKHPFEGPLDWNTVIEACIVARFIETHVPLIKNAKDMARRHRREDFVNALAPLLASAVDSHKVPGVSPAVFIVYYQHWAPYHEDKGMTQYMHPSRIAYTKYENDMKRGNLAFTVDNQSLDWPFVASWVDTLGLDLSADIAPQQLPGSSIRGYSSEALGDWGFSKAPLMTTMSSRFGDVRTQGLPTYSATSRQDNNPPVNQVVKPWKVIVPAKTLHPVTVANEKSAPSNGLRGWASAQAFDGSLEAVENNPDAKHPGPTLKLPRQSLTDRTIDWSAAGLVFPSGPPINLIIPGIPANPVIAQVPPVVAPVIRYLQADTADKLSSSFDGLRYPPRPLKLPLEIVQSGDRAYLNWEYVLRSFARELHNLFMMVTAMEPFYKELAAANIPQPKEAAKVVENAVFDNTYSSDLVKLIKVSLRRGRGYDVIRLMENIVKEWTELGGQLCKILRDGCNGDELALFNALAGHIWDTQPDTLETKMLAGSEHHKARGIEAGGGWRDRRALGPISIRSGAVQLLGDGHINCAPQPYPLCMEGLPFHRPPFPTGTSSSGATVQEDRVWLSPTGASRDPKRPQETPKDPKRPPKDPPKDSALSQHSLCRDVTQAAATRHDSDAKVQKKTTKLDVAGKANCFCQGQTMNRFPRRSKQ
ncbi:uncharacterized protein PG986_001606 [Apiospora aurea]|uniref:Uncharacterized protein n=1 Tax=Apiospora aurea TaxID=335848 RepID=A0ABR1QXE9_9PEZI